MHDRADEGLNRKTSLTRRRLGKRLLAVVAFFVFAASFCAWLYSIFDGFVYQDVYFSIVGTSIFFGGFFLALFLALAPWHPLWRATFAGAAILLWFVMSYAGFTVARKLTSPEFAPDDQFLLIPMAIAVASFPGLLLRFFRGWSVQPDFLGNEQKNANVGLTMRKRVREPLFGIGALVFSAAVFFFVPKDSNQDSWLITTLQAGPFLFIAGFIVLVCCIPLLKAGNYLFWSAFAIIAVVVLIAPGIAILYFVANSPQTPSLEFFFWSTEFVLSEVLLGSLALLFVSTTIGIRMTGYSFYAPPKKDVTLSHQTQYGRNLKPHPLD